MKMKLFTSFQSKLTLSLGVFLSLILFTNNAWAQGATCGAATAAPEGVTITAPSFGGNMGASNVCFPFGTQASDAIWYTWTPASCGTVDIGSSIDPNLTDTRLSLYAGTCGGLVCVDSDDDGGPGFTSQITNVDVTGGVTYYIEWDDRWSDSGFDWDIQFTANAAGICPDIDPANVTISNVTATSFDLAWAACGIQTDIEVCPSGINPGSTSCVVVADAVSPVTVGGLSPGNYTIYMTDECLDAMGVCCNVSLQVNVGSVCLSGSALACAGTVQVTLLEEGFESGAPGWTFDPSFDWLIDANGTPSFGTGPTAATCGSNYLYWETSGAAVIPNSADFPGLYNLVYADAANLSFLYHAVSTFANNRIDLQVSTDFGATWTTIWFYDTANGSTPGAQADDFVAESIDLAAYLGQVLQLRLTGTIDNGFDDIAFDEFKLVACVPSAGPAAPVITFCPPDVTVNNDPGVCEAFVDLPDLVATDDQLSPLTVFNTFSGLTGSGSGDLNYPFGTTTMTWIVLDNNGNSATCQTSVTVVDSEPPTFTCPGDVTITLAPGECTIPYTYEVTVSDNCPQSGNSAGFENYYDPANWTYTDANNNHDLDVSGAPASIVMTAATSTGQSDLCINAGDDGTISFDWDYSNPNDGACWDPFGITLNGVYTEISSGLCASTQESGSESVAVLAGDQFCFRLESDFIFGPAVTTISNFSGPWLNPVIEPNQSMGPLSGTEIGIGQTCYAFDYTDGSGNMGGCSWCVTVESFPDPVQSLACNDQVNLSLDENCEAYISADMFLEGGPYGCYLSDYYVFLSGGYGQINDQVISIAPGTYTVTVQDVATGNMCWGTVLVEDKLAPELPCADVFISCLEDAGSVPLVPGFGGIAVGGAGTMALGAPADVSINVPASGTILDLNVFVDISAVGGNQTAALNVTITSPAGTTTNLWAPGLVGCGGDLLMTVDDEAPGPLTCAQYTTGMNASTATLFAVFGLGFPDLDVFEGEDAFGTWVITVSNGANDVIVNSNFQLIFQGVDQPELTVASYLASQGPCGAVDLTYSEFEVDGDCNAGYTKQIIRTYTARDAAGNVATCTQNIYIERKGLADLGVDWFWQDGRPNDQNNPQVLQLDCGASTDPAAMFDFFYNEYRASCHVTPGSAIAEMICHQDAINYATRHVYPYTCQDVVISGNDSGGNYVSVAALSCRSIVDNLCNMFFTYSDQVLPACGVGCNGNSKTIRTWTVLDWCTGETGNNVQIIKSTDTNGPTIDLPGDMTVSASPWGCAASFYLPGPEHLYDDCSETVTYTVTGPGATLDADGNWVVYGAPKGGPHAYVYTAEDCCGNVSLATLYVTVIDATPPIAIAKQYIVVSLTGSPNSANGQAKLFAESVDNGSHDGDCGPVKVVVRRIDGGPDCGNVGIDGHNNNSTYSNFDTQDPFDRDDTDGGAFVKFCCEDLTGPSSVDEDGDGVPDYARIEVELGVWDDGNMDGVAGTPGDNFAITWAYVRVEDKLNPVILCPNAAKIPCTMDETDDFIIDNKLGRATASSTCGLLSTTYTDVCDVDLNGNGYIGDKDVPVWIYDASLGYYVTCYVDEKFNKACHYGPIMRTWTIEGTSISCTQLIIIDEPETLFDGNDAIDWPYDRSGSNEDGDVTLHPNNQNPTWSEVHIECVEELNEIPEWTDAACSLVGWSLDSDTFYFEGDACLKIINTYTVIDWCQYNPNDPYTGGVWTWTVVGKLLDEISPEVEAGDEMFAALPGVGGSGTDLNQQNCYYPNPSMSAVAVDTLSDCPSEWIKWLVQVDLYNDWNYDFEWSSFVPEDGTSDAWDDDNGNFIPDVRVGNRALSGFDPDNLSDFATAPGETYTINIPASVPADCGATQHRVVWKAYDGCGNVTSTTSYFTVQDKKAPTPYCINLSTALMADPDGDGPAEAMVELWAIDFDAGSFDNCTDYENLRFTFSDVPPSDDPAYRHDLRSSAKVFTCESTGGANDAILTEAVYVWDECGNYDFCLVNLRIVNNSETPCDTSSTGSLVATVSGHINTEFGESVENVEVMANSFAPEYPSYDMTDNTGTYAFANNPMYFDYDVTGDKNDDYLNGVSTLDLVLIQRHILGLETLATPYKMIAADVNSDQSISAIDLVELRKLILGIYSELPQNDSWRFVDADQVLDITNPWNFDETVNVAQLDHDMMTEDFVGVKIGDVNESVVANVNSATTEERSVAQVELLFEDREVSQGEVVEVAFTGSEFANVFGYQFTMLTSGLELQNVASGEVDVTSENFGSFGNIVTTSWNSDKAVTTDGNLFTLTFKSNVNGRLSDLLDLNSEITRAEAYVGDDLTVVNLDLRDGGDTAGTFALYQNQPNPFDNVTVIGFTLPEAGNANVKVYDVTGKIVKLINGDYAKGYNEITVNKSELGASGVLYYQLDSGDFTATKKMIIIE